MFHLNWNQSLMLFPKPMNHQTVRSETSLKWVLVPAQHKDEERSEERLGRWAITCCWPTPAAVAHSLPSTTGPARKPDREVLDTQCLYCSCMLLPEIWITHAGLFSGGSDGTKYEDGYLCDQLRQHSLLKIKWLTNYLIPAEKSCLLCRFGSWTLHSPQQRWSRGWWNNFSGYCFLKPFLITLLGEALFKTLYPEKEKTEVFQYISCFCKLQNEAHNTEHWPNRPRTQTTKNIKV